MSRAFKVVVHGPRGETVTLDLCDTEEQMDNMTVLQLKEKIEQRFPWTREDYPRLVAAGKQLYGDDTLLSDYGIHHMSHIYLVERNVSGASQPPETCCIL